MKLLRNMKILMPLILIGVFSGCTSVRFNEKEQLGDRIMQFDFDHLGAEMQGHILTPREGAIGGFYAVGAGGCGCN
jgi:hypothetical protein